MANAAPASFDYTSVFEKLDDRWQIIHERAWETPVPPVEKMDAEIFQTWAKFLNGEWDFVLDTGKQVKGTVTWTSRGDGELMTAEFTAESGVAHELSGWRPESGQWLAQGFGAGGNHWTLEFIDGNAEQTKARYRGRLDDGTVFAGDFVGRKVDENTYRWDATTKDSSGKESKSSGVYKRKTPR